jgi:hypothetical protein
MESSYALFTLFFSEKIFEKISNSINAYACLNRETDHEFNKFQDRSWKNINAAEIKIFFTVLIYMKLHDSKRNDLY